LAATGYWRRQVREPVQFRRAMEGLAEAGYQVFVEIGPGTTLLGLGRQCLESNEGVWLASLRRGEGEWRQMLESLGRLYERGAEVDWAGFDQPYERRRVALPTYPFERQRYWLDMRPHAQTVKRTGNLRHPFLEARVPAAIPIYQGRIHPVAYPFLAEHRVGGTAVLPAGGYVELALAAAAETGGLQKGAIHDLVLLEPLRLDHESHQVQVVLSAPGKGEAQFQIFGRPESAAEGEWTLHATGRIASANSAATAEPETQVPAEEVSPDRFYETLWSRGFELGPACRVIQTLTCGDGRAVAQVQIDPGASDGFHAHPALVDGWLQTLGAALLFGGKSPAPGSYVAAGVRALRIFAQPQGRLTVHASIAPDGAGTFAGRLSVFDASGKIIAAAEGISLRRIESVTEAAPDDWFYQVIWQRSGEGTASPAANRYSLLGPQLDHIVALHIADAFRQLRLPPGTADRIQAAEFAQYGVLERHRPLFARMLEILREDGWEECSDLPQRWQAIEQDFPEFAAEIDVTHRCAFELANVLQGKTDPLHLLFPNGSSASLERLYRESPVAQVMNELVGRAVSGAMASVPADRPLRVLEIGAGTASTTLHVAPLLATGRTEYVFTDVSPLFLDRAKEKLAAYPFVRYRLLDIEKDPAEQGFTYGRFDVVIAANVLHATTDLRRSVANAVRLLAPGGLLVALEGTRPERWVDVTFGMTEGWWKFSDTELRPNYPLLAKNKWLELLGDLGVGDASIEEPLAGANQALLTGHAGTGKTSAGRWLLAGDDAELKTELAARIQQAGGSAEGGASPAGEFDHVIYLAGADSSAVLSLAHEIIQSTAKKPRLWLVTRGAQPIPAGSSKIVVAQAAVWGLARSLALEHPEFWGGVLDLDPDASAAECAASVVDSVLHPDGEDQAAFRSGERYVPRLMRCPAPDSPTYRFSAEAAYLITGGLGSLGLTVARWMAENGARKLVLAGRRGVRTSRQAQAIQEIEAMGAVVRTATLDIADPGQLREFAGTFASGELRGIVHAAAVFDWSTVAEMTPKVFASVTRPKIAGAWALHEWSKSLALDFFVMFSSTTSLLGSRSLAHYAAGNQFLDALAHYRAAEGLPALTINWGTWDEMGETSDEQRQAYRQLGLYPMRSALALNALGRLLNSTVTQAVVAEIGWDVLRPIYEARRRRPLLSALSTPTANKAIAPVKAARPGLAAAVAAVSGREHQEIVTAFVREHAASVLGLRPDEVDVGSGLFEMGMDSLMCVELKGRLQQGSGLELPSTLTFNYPSVRALTGYLLQKLAPALPVTEQRQERQEAAVCTDNRSEDELATLLADTLRTL